LVASEARIVTATKAHAAALELTLRPEERRELAASGGEGPIGSLAVSVDAITALWGDEVVAMAGIGKPVHPTVGGPAVSVVWFLTGAGFPLRARHFMKPAKEVLRRFLETVGVLVNLIDARYEAAVRWAKWLGFEILPPIEWGRQGRKFHPARLRRA
jgi:hypothetical protein